MRYIVTGADGQLGGRVAANMMKEVPASQLIFTCPSLSRLPQEKLATWKSQGIEVREANYDDGAQMTEAFKDGDRMFFVSSVLNGPERVKQHISVINAAVEAGVKHITYTSFLGANRPEYTQYVLPDHTATEEYLRKSGLDYNIMRNNLYLENYLTNSVLFANLTENKWCTTAGEGKATFIAKDDSGRVATALLLGKGENNKDYDVTGNLISQREICEMIAEFSGIPYQYVPMNTEAFYTYLDSIHIPRGTDGDYSKSPVPWCSNDMVTNEKSIGDGWMAIETNTVELLTGRKPLNANELLNRYRVVWEERLTNYWEMVTKL